jgi:hypothetical protein
MISFGPTCDNASTTPPTLSVNSTSAEYGVTAGMADALELLRKAEDYVQDKGHRIVRKARLGGGTDGEVWRSTRPSAIKVVIGPKNYQDELESYRRLNAANLYHLNGFDIPRLVARDDRLQIIEMSIVQPPYLLDFGKVYFDHPPTDVYDDPTQRLEADVKANFGPNAPAVSRLLYALRERVGIWYADPKPANIDCGIDDPNWDKEPALDYSQYEDEAADER